jgi:hypothetical protein
MGRLHAHYTALTNIPVLLSNNTFPGILFIEDFQRISPPAGAVLAKQQGLSQMRK